MRGPAILSAHFWISVFVKCLIISALFLVAAELKAVAGSEEEGGGVIKGLVGSDSDRQSTARKLLQSPELMVNMKGNMTRSLAGDDEGGDMNRIGSGCSKEDVAIYQGQTDPLPDGIPTYTVQILNMCVSDCSIADIHVSCGWFSSTRLVNPRVFRRIYYDDCLVNDGNALGPGESLSFQYANSFSYSLSVSTVSCY